MAVSLFKPSTWFSGTPVEPVAPPLSLSDAIFKRDHVQIEARLAEGNIPTEKDLGLAVRAKAVNQMQGMRDYEYDLKTAGLLKGFMTPKTKVAFVQGHEHVRSAMNAGRVGSVFGDNEMRDLVNTATSQASANAPAPVKAVAKTEGPLVAAIEPELPAVPHIPKNAGLDFGSSGGGLAPAV